MVNTNASWYAYPNGTDTETVLNFFQYVSRSVDGLLFPVIMLVLWFISFVGVFSAGGANKNAAARAWTFASFLTSILMIPLVIVGLMAAKFMYISFLLLAIGVMWLVLSNPAGD